MGINIVEFLLSGFTDNSGEPLNGGLVYTYESGSLTPKPVYVDSDAQIEEQNPVQLDANGRKQVYASGSYKFVIRTSAGVLLYTFDNLFFEFSEAITQGDISTLNTAGSEILIRTPISMTGNLTLTAPVRILKGGSLTTDGHVLTINGPLVAEKTKIFFADKNEVILGPNSCLEAYPEWWGAIPDGATNCCDAIRCAIGAFKTIRLSEGTYIVSGTADSGDQMLYLGINDGTTDRSGMFIFGAGEKSILKLGDTVGRSKLLFGGGNSDDLSDMTFRDFKIDLNGSNNLQTAFVDPLRLNSAFYFSSHCENITFERLFITDMSGSQCIRIGNDSGGDVGTNIKVIHCAFENFGIGLPSNLTQDCSVLYLEARNILVEGNIFRNADFTFDLARGQTAVELHGENDVKVVHNTFEYVQLPILISSPYTGAFNTYIAGNVFRQCNYLCTFDPSEDGNAQSRVDIIGNIYVSTKVMSVLILIGVTAEGARGRAQINFIGNILNGVGNTNRLTHIFRVENTYLDSITIAENDVSSFLGCLIYMGGPALPDGVGTIKIIDNRLDSLGNVGGSDFPTVPTMVLVAPSSNTLDSLIIQGNQVHNTLGKDYSGLGAFNRGGNIRYLYIGQNQVHMSDTYPVITGTLLANTQKYEQYLGTADQEVISGGMTVGGDLLAPSGKLSVGTATLLTGQLARIFKAASGATKPTNLLLELEDNTNTGMAISIPGTAAAGYYFNTPAGAYDGAVEYDAVTRILTLKAAGLSAFAIDANGKPIFLATNTAGGTTGAQTINKASGTVNFAIGATSLVVTNALVNTGSIVLPVVRTNDSTAVIKNVVCGSGSFTIRLNAAATAETSVGFIVFN